MIPRIPSDPIDWKYYRSNGGEDKTCTFSVLDDIDAIQRVYPEIVRISELKFSKIPTTVLHGEIVRRRGGYQSTHPVFFDEDDPHARTKGWISGLPYNINPTVGSLYALIHSKKTKGMKKGAPICLKSDLKGSYETTTTEKTFWPIQNCALCPFYIGCDENGTPVHAWREAHVVKYLVGTRYNLLCPNCRGWLDLNLASSKVYHFSPLVCNHCGNRIYGIRHTRAKFDYEEFQDKFQSRIPQTNFYAYLHREAIPKAMDLIAIPPNQADLQSLADYVNRDPITEQLGVYSKKMCTSRHYVSNRSLLMNPSKCTVREIIVPSEVNTE